MARKAGYLWELFDTGNSNWRRLPLECVGYYVQLFEMAKGSKRLGYLCDPHDSRLPLDSTGLASLTFREPIVVDGITAVLLRAQLLARTSDGFLYLPSMVAAYELSVKRQTTGKGGGHPLFFGKPKIDQSGLPKRKEEFEFNSSSFSETQNPTPRERARAPCPPPGAQGGGEVLVNQSDVLVNQNQAENLVNQNPADGLVNQNPELRAVVVEELVALFQTNVKGRKKEPNQIVRDAVNEMIDEGISVAAIRVEMSLGPLTAPKRKRDEWIKELWNRLRAQMGFAAGSTQAGPALAEGQSSEESPTAEPAKKRRVPPGPASWLKEQEAKEKKIG